MKKALYFERSLCFLCRNRKMTRAESARDVFVLIRDEFEPRLGCSLSVSAFAWGRTSSSSSCAPNSSLSLSLSLSFSLPLYLYLFFSIPSIISETLGRYFGPEGRESERENQTHTDGLILGFVFPSIAILFLTILG